MIPTFKRNAFSDPSEVTTAYKVMETFFKLMHILLGADYGFFRHRSQKFKYLIPILTFLYCCLLVGIVVSYLDVDKKSFKFYGTIWSLGQYLMSASILLLFRRNTTFADFNTEIRKIDFDLRIKSSTFNIEMKLLFIISFFSTIRWFTGLYSCLNSDRNTCPEPWWTGIFFAGFILSIDTCLAVCAMVFYAIHCRLFQLLSILNDANIRSLLMLYKTIVDLTEKYKNAYNSVVSRNLIYTY